MKTRTFVLLNAALVWALAVGSANANASEYSPPAADFVLQADQDARNGPDLDKFCWQTGSGIWECESCGVDEAKKISLCITFTEYRD